MAVHYQVREISGGLEIAVTRSASALAGSLTAVLAAVAVGFVARGFLAWPFWLSGALLGGSLGFLFAYPQSRSVLKATNLEFQTSGSYPVSISRADVASMFYDEGQGDEGSYTPEGLYANEGICLLPYLNEKQTFDIIATIYEKFPDMPLKRTNDGGTIWFRSLTTLDLNRLK